jgi:cell division protein ZapA
MAQVTLSIGGYQYQVACRDGEEPHLQRLGELVDAKATEARSAVGNASEVRQLLLSALLFADEAIEGNRAAPIAQTGATPTELTAALEALAIRVESIATRLEKQHQPA